VDALKTCCRAAASSCWFAAVLACDRVTLLSVAAGLQGFTASALPRWRNYQTGQTYSQVRTQRRRHQSNHPAATAGHVMCQHAECLVSE